MKKKKFSNPVCDNLQWKKHRNQCATKAVWRNADKYTSVNITMRVISSIL